MNGIGITSLQNTIHQTETRYVKNTTGSSTLSKLLERNNI